MLSSTMGYSACFLLAVAFRPSAACKPCLSGLINGMPLGSKTCNSDTLTAFLKGIFNHQQSKMRGGKGCPWGFDYELEVLTSTTTQADAKVAVGKMCQVEPPEIETTEWTDIDNRLTPDFMTDYTDGFTDLNTKIGNFKNPNKSDPRKNAKYPTDEFSYTMGMSIDRYYEKSARTTALQPVFHLDNCQFQTIMCCFGSDRQSDDNNGDCAANNCDNAKPADNTNVCYHKGKRYPGDETAHCHGFAWSNDPSSPSYKMRFNNLFYVNMHDHMYNRGYVKPVFPRMKMCGCVEDMPVVSRADCTEITTAADYTVSVTNDGDVQIVIESTTFDFAACQGFNPNVDTSNSPQNNDLLAHVEKLFREDNMDGETRYEVGTKLVQNCATAGFGNRM